MNDINNLGCQCEWLGEEQCSEVFYEEHNGRRYCVLHYPNEAKKEDFEKALESRLDENNDKYLNFVGVWFPDLVSFLNQRFTKLADFSLARFNSDVEFTETHFDAVRFVNAHFNGQANFAGAHFHEIADFCRARFDEPVSFSRASFYKDGRFVQTQFAEFADFSGVEFEDDAYFNLAAFTIADFGAVRIPITSDKSKGIEKPEFEMYRSKFKNAQFNGAMFTRCTFRQACFLETAQFLYTQFSEASDFSIIDFNKSDFSNSRLSYANFDGSFFLEVPVFNKCELYGNTVFATARLPGADFSDAIFNGHADFTLTRFENSLAKWEHERLKECHIEENAGDTLKPIIIRFDKATFKEGLTFKGNELYQDKALLSFDDAVFEKPERVRFVSISMPPHSFMNVDPRKFHFIDTRWGFVDKRTALSEARNALQKHGRFYSPPMLELAFRQLAVNAEDSNRYEQAADLRYLAMEVARSMRWRRIDWLRLSWWYWLLSGYGEKVRRAFTALLVIWFLFAIIYWKCADATWWQPNQTANTAPAKSEPSETAAKTFTAAEALLYSAGVMALQKPEPLPANKRAKLFVLLETVLGPVQAALLALAIRRKFMR